MSPAPTLYRIGVRVRVRDRVRVRVRVRMCSNTLLR